MSSLQPIESGMRASALTTRELQRREIASQIERFLQHGGSIDVLRSPLSEMHPPLGRVWWEGESLARQ